MVNARLIVYLMICAVPLTAQKPAPACGAYPQPFGGSVMWPTAFGASTDPKYAPGVEALRALMSGTYDVVMITTEGQLTPSVAQWPLQLLPARSEAVPPCQSDRCNTSTIPLVGHRGPRLSQSDNIKLARRQLSDSDEFRVAYTQIYGSLYISNSEGLDGAGVILFPSEVTADGFVGRWEDGGPLVAALERDHVKVLEKESGYFCATKRRP